MLKNLTMNRSEKPLPLTPQTQQKISSELSPAPPPLEREQWAAVNQQNINLKQQNETLRCALRKKNERIIQLQQQMAEYQRYITQQHEDFARVTRKVHSAFQDYYFALESSNIRAMDADPTNEPAPACAAFSDSEEDLI
ncbi:hypothetical protein M441DRAFT_356692 [Trichoderma asperellum CBS 433.97]|uniref:Uncharacterized protein n=1 Tax=Trichoderma asperellum (strain ATCC 204424 / CBS 433.97 / NBRC 101777) TaxID=1042311 RepID=A0A2T3YQT4_TRIA4|nr:hypothetical protein M441DRAFT_356692 [Trichoderma asperellum CBS 433.97]PTB34933.1 hypothetical protein M441DRAFT_356692 [Trichoderma asperellum CBS 433.97]